MQIFVKTSLLLCLVIITAACGATEETPAPAADTLETVTLGVSYIPDVQFAPLYVAQSKGFYAEEGIEVQVQYGFENDFIALAAQGENEFAFASGDQIILARAQGLPITYVMTWYQKYPVALAALDSAGIQEPADLAGKTVGVPGFFGANFIGWEALAYANQLDTDSITLEEIGFTQVAALQQGVVDAAMVYTINEPVQLRSQGLEVNVIETSDYINLVSNGLAAGDSVIAENPDLVGRMVRATLRGIEYTLANPDEAFEITRAVIPEITDETAPMQRQVLEAALELWQTDQPGYSHPDEWQASIDFMVETGFLSEPRDATEQFTNEFIPAP